MAWPLLLVAGLFEILWAWAMKQSDGFTRLPYVAIMLAGMVVSVVLLALAMRELPLGTAYAVWTGIGAGGAFLIGILFMGEAATPLRLLAGAMIVGGIVLLKLASD